MLADMSAQHAPLGPAGPEARLLHRSISQPAAHDTSSLHLLTQEVADWPLLLRLAMRHDLLPSLHALLQTFDNEVPPDVCSFLATQASGAHQRAEVLEQELRVIADALREKRLCALVLRAPYPQPRTSPREPAVPVLFVPPGALDTARAALLRAGFAATLPAQLDRTAWSCGREMRYHVAPRFGDEGHPAIQLVWHLTPRYVPGQVTWDWLRTDATPYWPGHETLVVPDQARALMADSLLGALEAWERLADISSFSACATLATDGIWTRALAEARLQGVTRRLRLAAGLAREATGVPMPPAVATGKSDDRGTRALIRQVLADASTDRLVPRHALARHRLLARTLDGVPDRLRYGLGVFRDQRSRMCLALCQALPRRLPPAQLRNGGPTPQASVEVLLTAAAVTPADVVYDLGCGDGRVLLAAAQRGARAVGVELDPASLTQARDAVRHAGVEALVSVRRQDLFSTDLSEATVVTLNLGRAHTMALSSRLRSQLRPGSRIVALNATFGDWSPEQTWRVPLAEGAADQVSLWRVPASTDEAGDPAPAGVYRNPTTTA